MDYETFEARGLERRLARAKREQRTAWVYAIVGIVLLMASAFLITWGLTGS